MDYSSVVSKHQLVYTCLEMNSANRLTRIDAVQIV